MRILATAPDALEPHNGIAVRVLSLLASLRSNSYKVDYFPVLASNQMAASVRGRLGLNTFPIASAHEKVAWRVPHLSVTPESAVEYNLPHVRRAMRSAVSKSHYDAALVFSTLVMPTVLRVFRGPIVLDTGSIDSLIFQRRLIKSRGLRRVRVMATWLKWRRFESRMIRSATRTTVVSDKELAAASRLVTSYGRWAVVENGVDTHFYEYRPASRTTKRLLFLGAIRYPSNYDDLRWFLTHVFPLVKRGIPNAELVVTGYLPSVAEIRPLSDAAIRMVGFVRDLRPTMAECAVSVVPTQVGAGSRIKILESMSAGVAVVSTELGAEGLRVTPGENIHVTNDPRLFAEHILDLLMKPSERETLSRNARNLVENTYSWREQGAKLAKVLDEVITNG